MYFLTVYLFLPDWKPKQNENLAFLPYFHYCNLRFNPSNLRAWTKQRKWRCHFKINVTLNSGPVLFWSSCHLWSFLCGFQLHAPRRCRELQQLREWSRICGREGDSVWKHVNQKPDFIFLIGSTVVIKARRIGLIAFGVMEQRSEVKKKTFFVDQKLDFLRRNTSWKVNNSLMK